MATMHFINAIQRSSEFTKFNLARELLTRKVFTKVLSSFLSQLLRKYVAPSVLNVSKILIQKYGGPYYGYSRPVTAKFGRFKIPFERFLFEFQPQFFEADCYLLMLLHVDVHKPRKSLSPTIIVDKL